MDGSTALNKHQQKTEATKAKLFKAAQRVFARHGFEAGSIDQIAKVAGFTRGAFYAHFKSKEDLFFAMLEERAAAELQELRLDIQGKSEVARLEMVREYCALRLRDVQWSILLLEFKLYIARRGARGKKIAERYQTLRNNLKEQYMADVLPEYMKPDTVSKGKHMIFEAIIDGLSLQRAYKGSVVTEQDAERELKRAFDSFVESK